MADLFAYQEQDDLLKSLEAGKAASVNKRIVLNAFERLSRRIIEERPDMFGDDSLFAATEWLLYAHAKGDLTWQDLATLIKHKVDYSAVFSFLGGEPCDFDTGVSDARSRKWWQKKHDRSKYVQKLAKREMKEDFIGTIRWLVEYLQTKNMKVGSVGKKDILAGRSPEFLLHLRDFRRYDASGRHQEDRDRPNAGAHVYESELLADKGFVSDLAEIAKDVCAKHRRWYFCLYNDSEWTFEKMPDPGKRTNIGEKTPRLSLADIGADLPTFCRKWCLREVSVDGIGYNAGKGVRFAAQRVRVSRMETGVEVFIPRYYNFNDIKYRSEDFMPLKRALDESYGKLSLRKSRRAKIEEAKRLRKSLLERGMPRAAAWDETKNRMDWNDETMAHYLGDRPAEHKIDHGPRRPRSTKLPSR